MMQRGISLLLNLKRAAHGPRQLGSYSLMARTCPCITNKTMRYTQLLPLASTHSC